MTGAATEEPPRCSARSRAVAEPLEGTASTVGAFLLLEVTGPWGVDAVRDSRLPAAVKERLRGLERRHGVRPLLVRRPGRPGRRRRPGSSAPGAVRAFAAYTRGDRPWAEATALPGPAALLDEPLEVVGRGGSPGWTPHRGPLLLVCTHGRHDPCCAERGRPLAAALAEVAAEETWEVSHVGGDRFAGNVLVLPAGLYYGRVEPGDAARFAAAHLAGRVDLGHLRGRTAYPFAVQAAEVHLRRHLGEAGLDAVRLEGRSRAGAETTAVFAVGAVRWEVRVRSAAGEPRALTCRAATTSAAPVHEVTSLRRLDGRPDGLVG